MNFIVVIIFTIFTSALAININRKTLNKWYEEIEGKVQKISSESQFSQITSKINFTCIKTTKLNLPQNGEKELNFAEGMIAVYGAGFECFDENELKIIWRSLLDLLINSYKQTVKPEEIKCFKIELKKFDPNSLLASDINSNVMSRYDDFCKDVVDNDGLDKHLQNLEDRFRSLSDLTCKKVNFVEFKKTFIMLIILSHETAPYDRLKSLLANFFQDKMKLAYNCVIERIGKQIDLSVAPPQIETTKINNFEQSSTVQPPKITTTSIYPPHPSPVAPIHQHQYQHSNSYAASSSYASSSSGHQEQMQFSVPGFQSQGQSQSFSSSYVWGPQYPNVNPFFNPYGQSFG
jgi:hypothetical protein